MAMKRLGMLRECEELKALTVKVEMGTLIG
jgi:hypothetical protein